MKQKYGFTKLLLVACSIFLVNFTYAQRTIKGNVTDSGDGSPLVGVTVLEKGTTKGTITDFDGNYEITISEGASLVFSYVGYKTTVKAATENAINVRLEMDTQGLDEIVVIGYGQVKKGDATGSVSTISAADFNQGAITAPQELLKGRVAGVVITPNNGEPGGGAQIRIRGGSSLSASNDPLFVIDGIPLDNEKISGLSNPLSTINPNDIETFTVLKDASATAIYGARASNGVIIITTKRGKAGKALAINYSGNFSIGTPIKYLDVLNAADYIAIANEKVGTVNITPESLNFLGNEDTDWQKEIYENAVSQDHNISLMGSVADMPFRFSYGFTDQNGILKNTDMKRHSISASLDPSFLNNTLKLKFNVKGGQTKQSFGNTDAVGAAVRFAPTKAVMNNNTRYAGYTAWTVDQNGDGIQDIDEEYNQMATANPVAMTALQNNNSTVSNFTGNFQADYTFPFLPELRANMNMGIDAVWAEGYNNVDTTAVWTRRSGYGRLTDYNQDKKNEVIDFTLNYSEEMPGIASKVEVMGGYSWQHFWRKGDNYERSVVAENHPRVVADSTDYETESYLVSFFGRVNYTLLDRYLLTATVRQDGSSRFHEDNRWGLFPSFAFAWKINSEPFLKDVTAISELKLRLGWGQTGQQDIPSTYSNGDYSYMGTYTISENNSYYQFGDKWYPTLRPNAYDPNIKWETTTTKNIGFDFGFLDGRISGSVDYYERLTEDLINNIAIPNGSNFSNFLLTNVGELENKGWEAALNLIPISTENLYWELGFTFTHNTNEILKLTRTEDPNYLGVQTGGISGGTGNNIQIHSVGYPAHSFFVLEQIYNQEGMPIEALYVDRSGEGGNVSGNLNNYYHYKSRAPEYLMGLSTRLTYKNFDFSASGRISLGNYVYNNIAAETFYANMYTNSYWQNITHYIDDTKFENSQYFSDYFIQDGSYFKMDNITMGYSFKNLVKENLGGRLSFTVQNAFTITDYEGLDPELNNGIDNNIYPRPRIFMLALNLNF